MAKAPPSLADRLERLLRDPDRSARPSHILRAIESAAVDLSDHAQENLSDLIEWLHEAEALAQAGKLGDVTAGLRARAEKAPVVESGKEPGADARGDLAKTRRRSVPLVTPPKGTRVPDAKLYIDGGARGNPGPAAIGLVLEDDSGAIVWTHAEVIGEGTNNWAEYRALITGLEGARRLGVQRIEVLSDSELIVRQMRGQYKVKHPALQPLWAEAQRLARQFARLHMTHIPRASNRTADRLVNQALDEATSRA